MRALLVHDADGNVVSATVVRAGVDVQGEISQAVDANQRLIEVDISHLVDVERTHAESEHDAIARAISRLMKGEH